MKHFFITTRREDPQDAVVDSHKLMIRAGLIEKLGSGLYNILPMGLRVIRKIEAIVREEMNASGAFEFQLPLIVPAELWKETKRWYTMGKEMFRLKDRHQNDLVLGPTHEETFTFLIKSLISSYKDLPLNVYQIHTKFRDEIRPRFGVIRSREFIMKDAYSFHLDSESLEQTYQIMRNTYRKIFAKVGLETIPVEADTGAMGGSGSEEFMVPSKIGEEILLVNDDFSYRSNLEKTPVIYLELNPNHRKDLTEEEIESLTNGLKKIHTPNKATIEDLAKFLNKKPEELLKTLLYRALTEENNEILVMILIRGDRQINETKLKNHLKAIEVYPAKEQDFYEIGSVPGYAGPLNLKTKIPIIFDLSLSTKTTWITGANEQDYHIENFHPALIDKNWKDKLIDLALAKSGDPSPNGKGTLKEVRGIEVGHIFKLGDKYTKAMEFTLLDENQKRIYPLMGCYGIGINRTMATIIEQNHDEKGIQWPISVAPFEMILIDITKDEKEKKEVEEIYNDLIRQNFDLLWDTRDVRPGVKFVDSELIGFPIRITIGKNYFSKGEIEIYIRKTEEKIFINRNHLIEKLKEIRENLYQMLPKV
ncbi:MAG: proline--tRNA ligase [Leptonema sp. (in: bacteria)]